MDQLYYNKPYVKTFESEVLDCRQGKDGFFQGNGGRYYSFHR